MRRLDIRVFLANVLFASSCGAVGQTATWTQILPTSSPSARVGHAVALDAAHNQVVLFGGQIVTGYSNDTWTWDGSNWTQKFPAVSPPARAWHVLSFDASHNQVVLFGGQNGSGNLNDTWVFDGTSWTQQFPVTQPAVRSSPAMAFDAGHNQVVMFGGSSFSTLNDTWTWDGSNWTQRFPSNAPSPRFAHAMVYDSTRAQTLLFGGATDYSGPFWNDTWTWDGSNWTQKFPAVSPPARYYHSMAYDSARAQAVVFAGYEPVFGLIWDDTWTWSGATWIQDFPLNSPQARCCHAMAFDSPNNQVFLFGGGSYSATFGDTWLWDPQLGSIALWFPVKICGSSSCTPSNAVINAVFDHQMKRAYECKAGVGGYGSVMPFTNQLANGSPSSDGYGACKQLYGYQFTGPGTLLAGYNYNVAQDGAFLYYDSHPGYDYNFSYGTAVYPAINGCVTYLQTAAGVANAETGHILAIIPEATQPVGGCQTPTNLSGYSIVYMHLSSFYQNNPKLPNFGFVMRCTSSSPKVCAAGQHTVVCSTCAQQNEYVTTNRTNPIGYSGNFFGSWGGVQPHLHFEVDRLGGTLPVPVDPYGWCGSASTDPYTKFTGVTNVTLWANFILTCP